MRGSGEQLDRSEDRVHAYLDGMMPDDERGAFERDLQRDPALRQRVEQYRAIQQSLQRQFEPPSRAQLLAAAGLESDGPYAMDHAARAASHRSSARGADGRGWMRGRFAIAASIAAMLIGGWLLMNSLMPLVRTPEPYMVHRTLDAAYRHEVDGGLKPDWICENDAQFARVFVDRFHQPLLLTDDAMKRAAGLAYGHTISTRTVYVLAHVRGRPVIVFVDRLSQDDKTNLPESSDLNVFRREVAPFVLYEVTPWDEPAMLNDFYVPQAMPRDKSESSEGENT